jgi:hypothetical protein
MSLPQVGARYMLMSLYIKWQTLRTLTNIAGVDGTAKLANYMRDKYGFTTNATEDENNSGQTPMSVRFSDVPDEKTIRFE